MGDGGSSAQCDFLRGSKPTDCTGPEVVAGPRWGEQHFTMLSGLSRFINSLDNYPYTPTARQMLVNALSAHTAQVGDVGVTLDQANRDLLTAILAVCTQQRAETGADGCFSNLNRLVSEHSGEADNVRSTLQWLSFIPDPIVDILAPDNLLRLKYDIGNAQARCNIWHERMAQNGCY